MEQSKIKVIEKIKALLARGDSSHEEEARTSLFLAHRLMRKYGISYEDLGGGQVPRQTLSERMRELGRLGGKKSAQGRREKLSPEQRSEIARRAANSRWAKKR